MVTYTEKKKKRKKSDYAQLCSKSFRGFESKGKGLGVGGCGGWAWGVVVGWGVGRVRSEKLSGVSYREKKQGVVGGVGGSVRWGRGRAGLRQVC